MDTGSFINTHLQEICQELDAWHRTGLLKQRGRVKQLAGILPLPETMKDPMYAERRVNEHLVGLVAKGHLVRIFR